MSIDTTLSSMYKSAQETVFIPFAEWLHTHNVPPNAENYEEKRDQHLAARKVIAVAAFVLCSVVATATSVVLFGTTMTLIMQAFVGSVTLAAAMQIFTHYMHASQGGRGEPTYSEASPIPLWSTVFQSAATPAESTPAATGTEFQAEEGDGAAAPAPRRNRNVGSRPSEQRPPQQYGTPSYSSYTPSAGQPVSSGWSR